jgi:hypothetical protein
MDYENGVSKNMYLVSQSLEICIARGYFCFKRGIIYDLEKLGFQFVVGNYSIKCGKIMAKVSKFSKMF